VDWTAPQTQLHLNYGFKAENGWLTCFTWASSPTTGDLAGDLALKRRNA